MTTDDATSPERTALKLLPTAWLEEEVIRRKRRDGEMKEIRRLLDILDNPVRVEFTKRITERNIVLRDEDRQDDLFALVRDTLRAALSARHDELEAEIHEPLGEPL